MMVPLMGMAMHMPHVRRIEYISIDVVDTFALSRVSRPWSNLKVSTWIQRLYPNVRRAEPNPAPRKIMTQPYTGVDTFSKIEQPVAVVVNNQPIRVIQVEICGRRKDCPVPEIIRAGTVRPVRAIRLSPIKVVLSDLMKMR